MSFLKTLQSTRDGQLLALLSEQLSDVVVAVQTHGKSGSLSLTLSIKPNGEDAVTITPKVSTKVPETTIGDAIFFVSNGNLVRRNPRQRDIEDELEKRRDAKTATAGDAS